MPQKHYSCRGYFSWSVPDPGASRASQPGAACMATELSADLSWQGGDPNPSHALASLQWLLRGQHLQRVGHWESPQLGRQRNAASSTGSQGMPMAGRSHSPCLPSHCAWAPAGSPGLL